MRIDETGDLLQDGNDSLQIVSMSNQFRFSLSGLFLVFVSIGYCLTGLTGLHKNSIIGTFILSNFLMVDPYSLLHALSQCTIHSSCAMSVIEHIDYSEFTEIRQLSFAVLLLGLIGAGAVLACIARNQAGIYLLRFWLLVMASAALWSVFSTLHAGAMPGATSTLFWYSVVPIFWATSYWIAGYNFMANSRGRE